MATNSDMIEPEMETLMLRAPFADLTAAERAMVIAAFGSEEEYTRLRAAMLGVRAVFARPLPDLAPRPESLAELHAAMAAVSARRPRAAATWRARLAALLATRIPLYQPALALALLLVTGLVYMAGRGDGVREKIVYLQGANAPAVRVDTEAIVQRVVDSLRDELIRVDDDDTLAVAALDTHGGRARKANRRRIDADTALRILALQAVAQRRDSSPARITMNNRFVGLGNLPQLDRQRRGKSIAEDSTIGRFRGRVVSDRL